MNDEFDQIAQNTISDAEAVDCTFEEFVEGLRDINKSISERLSLAEAELGTLLGEYGDDE